MALDPRWPGVAQTLSEPVGGTLHRHQLLSGRMAQAAVCVPTGVSGSRMPARRRLVKAGTRCGYPGLPAPTSQRPGRRRLPCPESASRAGSGTRLGFHQLIQVPVLCNGGALIQPRMLIGPQSRRSPSGPDSPAPPAAGGYSPPLRPVEPSPSPHLVRSARQVLSPSKQIVARFRGWSTVPVLSM